MIWWLIFVIQFALLGVAYYYEAHLFFWANDITYISSGILALFFLPALELGTTPIGVKSLLILIGLLQTAK